MSAPLVAVAGLVLAAIEIDGPLGTLLLLLPLIVLLIVVVRALRTPQLSPPEQSEVKQSEILSVMKTEAPLTTEPKEPAVDTVPAPVEQPPAATPAPKEDWPRRIGEAEAANDLASVASHYLAYARDEIAAGRPERAADHLRSSVRASAKAKLGALQAEARLELAELARAAGDLTTACEHWQIARGLFHQLQQAAELGETERLMRQHGCPTDWVLNDF
jgi:hypothetical protein